MPLIGASDEDMADEADDAGYARPGRHSNEGPDGHIGKGLWLASVGLSPADLAGRIVAIAAYKGGVGKTFLAYELAYMLGAILVDWDWDRGNASRAWGYREEARVKSPMLDALDGRRVPRPLTGGQWRPDLVPCSSDFGPNQPSNEYLTDELEKWAGHWGTELQCPTVVDTHPGAQSSTYGAVAAAHLILVPVVLGERELEATEGMLEELKSYPLLLVPNKVGVSPSNRHINWLEKIAKKAAVPVGPPISNYSWLSTRSRRMAVTAQDPVPAKSRNLVAELHQVGEKVVHHVRTAA